jgi:hypothetical protein
MWKSLNPGESVSLGDIIRHISPHAISAFGERLYQVVRAELHYFEISPKQEEDTESGIADDRKIIKYTDIGYHLGVEIWLEQMGHAI